MDILNDAARIIKEGDEHIKLSESRNLTVFLGLTGAGKTTLSLLLTSDNSELISVKIGAGIYLITDKDHKISPGTDPLKSRTIIPDMMIDPTTKAVFYDMPGFKETRNSSMQIATACFMKKVLNHAERIKLIFVVDYNNVLPLSSRTEFPDLLRQVTNVIKNVDKFRDSIGMVVTKVQNTFSDDEVIENVAGFLRSILATGHAILNEQMIKLVNITLTKEGGKYTKMSLFRSPDREGPLSNITIVQKSKQHINQMIHQNIQYNLSNEEDFGYTISEQTEMNISDILKDVTQNLTQKLTNSMKKITQHFEDEENKNYNIETLQSVYNETSHQLEQIVESEKNSTGIMEFLGSVYNYMKSLNITESEQDLLDLKRLGENLKLIGVVSPKQTIDSSFRLIMAPVEDAQRIFENLKNWFGFLIILERVTSSYERLRNPPKKYNEIKEQLAAVERDESKMTGEDLAVFLDELSSGDRYIFGYDLMKQVVINSKRAKMLTQLLESTLTWKPTFVCYESTKVRITSLYLKFNETFAAPMICPPGLQTMEVFVGKKIWIDADFNGTEQNMNLVIVSPTWEVMGERKIQLDGYPGSPPSEPRAAPGSDGTQHSAATGDGENGGDGADGLPGLPGGNGGDFYGIADEIIKGERLAITVNGGPGGIGQDGGVGGNAVNGEDADLTSKKFRVTEETRHYWWGIIVKYVYTYHGARGGRGGAIGRGGIGGFGGHAGHVCKLVLKDLGNLNISTNDGNFGQNASRRLGGFDGLPGKDCYAIKTPSTLSPELEWSYPPCSYNGPSSPERNNIDRGFNYEGRKSPKAKSDPKFDYVLPQYQAYAKELRVQPYLVRFPTTLIDIPDNQTIKYHCDTHEVPSFKSNRYSSGEIANSSIYLLDVIVRKCTKVQLKHWHNDVNTSEKFVHPVNLTVKFEELSNELLENHIKYFDPTSMIEKLKLLMHMNNCYDKIYQFLYDQMKGFDGSSTIPDDYLKRRIEQLLIE